MITGHLTKDSPLRAVFPTGLVSLALLAAWLLAQRGCALDYDGPGLRSEYKQGGVR